MQQRRHLAAPVTRQHPPPPPAPIWHASVTISQSQSPSPSQSLSPSQSSRHRRCRHRHPPPPPDLRTGRLHGNMYISWMGCGKLAVCTGKCILGNYLFRMSAGYSAIQLSAGVDSSSSVTRHPSHRLLHPLSAAFKYPLHLMCHWRKGSTQREVNYSS